MIITNCTRCGATVVIFYGVILFVSGISHRVTFVKYVSVARDNCRTDHHETCSGWWWGKTCHTEEKQVCNGYTYVQETRHGIRCQYGWRDKDPGDCSVPICLYCGLGTQCTAPRNCTDIDECVAGTHRCSFVCINTIGSYKCACSTGYRLTSDRRTCEDIDECVAGTHRCSEVCNNTIGSYECDCSTGYRLTPDRRTCEVILVVHPVTVIDECKTETHNCSDVCINTNGSYECGCPTGYTLTFDRRTCEDCTTEEVEMSKDEDIYQNEAPVVEEAIYDSLDMSDVDGGDNHLYEPMRKLTTYLRK